MNAGNKGINNLGNTCYLNSVIQCISHLLFFHPLNNKIKKDFNTINDKHNLMYNWLKLNEKLWDNTNNKTINAIDFINSFQKVIKEKKIPFYNFNQNDSEEFITLLFDLLHNILKKQNKEKNIWNKFYKNDYSLIIENFYSKSKLICKCSNCDYKTKKLDPFMLYHLPINKNIKCINDSINLEFSTTILKDWKCDKCNNKGSKNIKCIENISKYIILHLKRYNNLLNKNNKFIEYSDILTIKNIKYKLIGIIIHSGNLYGGHYISICFNLLDKKWRLYNDSHVKELNEDEVFNKNPYCLFYKKII